MIKNLHQKLLIHAGILIQDLVTPHERRVRKATARPYVAGLMTLPLFFITNYLFNHGRLLLNFLPEGRPMYFFTIILPFGTLLPSLALGWLIREADGEAHVFGATLKFRDLKMTLLSLITGALIAGVPVGRMLLNDPALLGIGLHLFIWLFMVSLAEVLLFIGALFHAVEWLMLGWLPGRNRIFTRTGFAVVLTGLIYGLFHFSYADPWNTWGAMMVLVPAGILISLVYALTRSLAATAVFNNILAVSGYLLTGMNFYGSDTLGLVLNGIAVFAAIIILVLVGIYDEEF